MKRKTQQSLLAICRAELACDIEKGSGARDCRIVRKNLYESVLLDNKHPVCSIAGMCKKNGLRKRERGKRVGELYLSACTWHTGKAKGAKQGEPHGSDPR